MVRHAYRDGTEKKNRFGQRKCVVFVFVVVVCNRERKGEERKVWLVFIAVSKRLYDSDDFDLFF